MRNLTKPFQGSRIRLQTAVNQTLALSVALSKYAESGPFRPIVVNGGFSIRPIVTPPDWIAELLTAAIHSCRTSLDLLACDLVRLNNKSAKGVHFPFAENAEELDGQIKRKHFDRATPDVVELLRSFKPFKGGNLLLRAMHDIDVATKHDTILQISVFPLVNKLPEDLPQELVPIIGAPPYFVTSAVVFQDIKQEDISPIVAFAHNPLFHREVLETLKQIVELSFGIVEAFESHLHRSSRTPA